MENKIYTEKPRKLRQNTQKIANFLRYYGKIHSKLPKKIYTSLARGLVTNMRYVTRVIRDTKVMRMTRATSSISELTAVLVVVVLLIYRGSYGQTYRGSDKEHI